jgi:FkbH-like protein
MGDTIDAVDALGELHDFIRRLDPATASGADVLRFSARLQRESDAYFSRYGTGATPLTVALVSNANVQPIRDILPLCAAREGVRVRTVMSDYGGLWHDLTSPSSSLHASAPDVVVLLTFATDMEHLPPLMAGQDVVDACVEREVDRWAGAWAGLQSRTGARVIQHLFDAGADRPMVHLEANAGWSRSMFSRRVNLRLNDRKPAGVFLFDLPYVAASFGTRSWYAPAEMARAKFPFAMRAVPLYCQHLARCLASLVGRRRKCLVLDLDNTVWGGVVADDGIDGINLDVGNPDGESYIRFQRYVKRLAEHGIILAACSKGDETTAKAVFRDHPAMVLRLDDLACVIANANDKATNLRLLAQQLNIGLDSLVFFDDNPFEREWVRSQLPEVLVVDVPETPTRYVECLRDQLAFEALTLTKEDTERASDYVVGLQRQELQDHAVDYDSYLASLDMTGSWQRVAEPQVARVSQLVAKTNQFKLTTRTYAETEVQARVGAADRFGFCIDLRDRFGSLGLVSALLGRQEAGGFVIEQWVMSCRVFHRRVEEFFFDRLVSWCRSQGLQTLDACYEPTSRNQAFASLYERLGMTALPGDGEARRFRLDVKAYKGPARLFVRQAGEGA